MFPGDADNYTTTGALPGNWTPGPTLLPGSNMTGPTPMGDSMVPTGLEQYMQPNTALLTMSLTLFTFVVAYALKGLRNKKLLGRTVSSPVP